MLKFYPSHLSSELPFKRFNAERFILVPEKPKRMPSKRQRTSEVATARVVEELTEPECAVADAFEYIENILSAETPAEPVEPIQPAAVVDLNESFANSVITDDTYDVFHLGEDMTELNAQYEAERAADTENYDHQYNPKVPFLFEVL